MLVVVLVSVVVGRGVVVVVKKSCRFVAVAKCCIFLLLQTLPCLLKMLRLLKLLVWLLQLEKVNFVEIFLQKPLMSFRWAPIERDLLLLFYTTIK